MDPNTALANARTAARLILADADADASHSALADELAEAFEALDGWLSRGGFLPDSWTGAASAPAPGLTEDECDCLGGTGHSLSCPAN